MKTLFKNQYVLIDHEGEIDLDSLNSEPELVKMYAVQYYDKDWWYLEKHKNCRIAEVDIKLTISKTKRQLYEV